MGGSMSIYVEGLPGAVKNALREAFGRDYYVDGSGRGCVVGIGVDEFGAVCEALGQRGYAIIEPQ